MRVLTVEDDSELRHGIRAALRSAGFAVDVADDLPDADLALTVNSYDCAIFDRSLPSGDAIDYIKTRRQDGWAVPVLFLTARDSVADRIAGFASGADDYLIKPFAVAELIARVGVLCRRAPQTRPPVLSNGSVVLNIARREVTRSGVLLSLTSKEFAVLEQLVIADGALVTRTGLIEHCWDEMAEPASNVVDVVMAQLRRKLGDPPKIETVRGAGYRLADT